MVDFVLGIFCCYFFVVYGGSLYGGYFGVLEGFGFEGVGDSWRGDLGLDLNGY